MKDTLLPHLSCPECELPLSLHSFKREALHGVEEVRDGLLTCASGHSYIVADFIPRMLPDQLSEFPDFKKTYANYLSKPTSSPSENLFRDLQEKTKKSFSFEWHKWQRFGWDEAVPLTQTRAIFDYKVMFTPAELAGKLLLDAGCGNGRYSKVARDYGATVIGIDLSRAVDEAYKNFADDPDFHVVQGDLFKLPFKAKTFDYIFSNGVLMHTGNAKKAFLSLVSRLTDRGVISVHLYHKGNIVYEFNDWWLRAITTRLPLQSVYTFSKVLVAIARALPKKFVMYGLNMFLRIEDHEHYVFDWYTAPIATHHTYKEVYSWLQEAGLSLVADHNTTRYPLRRFILPFQFLTVKAQRRSFPQEQVKHLLT